MKDDILGDCIFEAYSPSINTKDQDTLSVISAFEQNRGLYEWIGLLFTVFGILVAVDIPADKKNLAAIPLIIIISVVLVILTRVARLMASRPWQSVGEPLRKENGIHFLVISAIHFFAIIALIIFLPPEARDFFFFSLVMLLGIGYFLIKIPEQKYEIAFPFLVGAISIYDLSIFLILLIPHVLGITENPLFVEIYSVVTQISIYLAFGGFVAFWVIVIFDGAYLPFPGPEYTPEIPFFSFLEKERQRGKYLFEVIFGFDILIVIILLTILW